MQCFASIIPKTEYQSNTAAALESYLLRPVGTVRNTVYHIKAQHMTAKHGTAIAPRPRCPNLLRCHRALFHSLRIASHRIASIYRGIHRLSNNLCCYALVLFHSIRLDSHSIRFHSSTSIHSVTSSTNYHWCVEKLNSLFGFFCLLSDGGLVAYGNLLL